MAGNDEYSVVKGRTLTVSADSGLLANDSDADGDPLTISLIKGPSNGSLNLNADGSFSFTPSSRFTGTATFQYQVSDGTSSSVVATAKINVLRSATSTVAAIDPDIVVQNDSYSSVKGQKLTVDAQHGVLSNDADYNALAMTAKLVTGSRNGTVKLNADGSFTFTPKSSFTGVTSFTYKVTDGQGTSTTATASITVSKTAGRGRSPLAHERPHRGRRHHRAGHPRRVEPRRRRP